MTDTGARLPHTYPFRFADTILQAAAPPADSESASALFRWQGSVRTRVSGNGRASMTADWSSPLLLAEAIAQAALMLAGEDDERGKRGFLAGIDDFEMTRAPRPGESLEIIVRLSAQFGAIIKFEGEVVCGGERLGRGSVLVRRGEG